SRPDSPVKATRISFRINGILTAYAFMSVILWYTKSVVNALSPRHRVTYRCPSGHLDPQRELWRIRADAFDPWSKDHDDAPRGLQLRTAPRYLHGRARPHLHVSLPGVSAAHRRRDQQSGALQARSGHRRG